MEQTKTILKKTWVVAALACVCCLLWGSAIPLIKTGYRLMQMDSADTASQIVFAGVRFALAGILVLIFASLRERKVLLPDRTVLKYAAPVCMAQTVCQYFYGILPHNGYPFIQPFHAKGVCAVYQYFAAAGFVIPKQQIHAC